MGMYTEIFINCALREDTPKEVVNDLRLLFDADYDADGTGQFLSDIPKEGRTRCIGSMSSFYFQPKATSAIWYSDIADQWYILSRSDLKNYDGEIEAFLEWLDPYIDAMPGEFVGYHRYEECDTPTLVLKKAY